MYECISINPIYIDNEIAWLKVYVNIIDINDIKISVNNKII